jgi:hypothetical protein
MMRVETRGIPALVARPSYQAALMERLAIGRPALRGHPFWERLEGLLAKVDQAYAGSANHPTMPPQRRGGCEELKEQYAPLFWHYLGRALRVVGEVEFALMEARIRCLLREFQGETGRLLADGPR